MHILKFCIGMLKDGGFGGLALGGESICFCRSTSEVPYRYCWISELNTYVSLPVATVHKLCIDTAKSAKLGVTLRDDCIWQFLASPPPLNIIQANLEPTSTKASMGVNSPKRPPWYPEYLGSGVLRLRS